MAGEKHLQKLLKSLQPLHNTGEFVFCVVNDLTTVDLNDVVMLFKEKEGYTVIIERKKADELQLAYSFIGSWITLTVHSSLSATGLTAAFSTALAAAGISCNVVAAYYHDHIFVNTEDTAQAMDILKKFAGE